MSISGSIPARISYYNEVTLSLPKENKEAIDVSTPGKTNKGSFVFSWGIGPATMVIAKLSNQEFAIYYADMPIQGCQGFRDFFEQLKKDDITINALYIFQKTVSEHAQKIKEKLHNVAAILYTTFNNYLIENPKFKADGFEIQLRRIQGDNYTGIICDSLNNCIILCGQLYRKTEGQVVNYSTTDNTDQQDLISPPVPFEEILSIVAPTGKRLTIENPETEGIIQITSSEKPTAESIPEPRGSIHLVSPFLSFFCCYNRTQNVSPSSEEKRAAPAPQGMK